MVVSRLALIFTESELRRISVQETPQGDTRIIADVHGMKCHEARLFINNIINIVRTAFQLIIIHGYNHGTAIKDMLAQSFSNRRIYKQFPDFYNKGVTNMFITA